MKLINNLKFHSWKKLNWGLNYKTDEDSIVEMIIKIPLPIIIYGLWLSQYLDICKGKRIGSLSIYFRIRKRWFPFVFGCNIYWNELNYEVIHKRTEIDDAFHKRYNWKNDKTFINLLRQNGYFS